MNSPRTRTTLSTGFSDIDVEVFPVNDDAALTREIDVVHSDIRALDDERRDALIALVTDALERLSRDPASWLPEAVVATSRTKFGIFILWENGHLDDAVLRQRVRAERDHHQRLSELEDLAGRVD